MPWPGNWHCVWGRSQEFKLYIYIYDGLIEYAVFFIYSTPALTHWGLATHMRQCNGSSSVHVGAYRLCGTTGDKKASAKRWSFFSGYDVSTIILDQLLHIFLSLRWQIWQPKWLLSRWPKCAPYSLLCTMSNSWCPQYWRRTSPPPRDC